MITDDGDPARPVYRYRTHQARHDRQTVLLQHGAPPVARLRDLNTRSKDAHLVYGHAWDGVDPRAWTPEYWERPAPDEESTCREADRLTRPSFERKRLN